MTEIRKNDNVIEIPSSEDYLIEINDFLEAWLRRKKVSEDLIADFGIVISELVNNAIRHGNKRDINKRVKLSLKYDKGEVTADIADQGSGFDPESIPNPIAKENLMKEIGRGVFIVRALVDKIDFNFLPGRGTIVTIKKVIQPLSGQ